MKTSIIIFFACLLLISCGDSGNTTDKYRSIELNAKISKSDTQLIVENLDKFNWKSVEIEINNEFTFKIPEIVAGKRTAIGFMDFTDSEYKKLNPFSIKVAEVTISATTSTGGIGFISASFN